MRLENKSRFKKKKKNLVEGRMTDGPLQHSEAGKVDWEGTKI